MSATTIDPYATLGIPAGASRDAASRAHRRLAKEFHPDVNAGPAAADRMRRINEAWRILSDPPGAHATTPTALPRSRPGPATVRGRPPTRGATSTRRPRTGSTTWTTWPESRVAAAARTRRPPRPDQEAPSFGDRPSVIVAVWMTLSLLFFIGSWLGSLAR